MQKTRKSGINYFVTPLCVPGWPTQVKTMWEKLFLSVTIKSSWLPKQVHRLSITLPCIWSFIQLYVFKWNANQKWNGNSVNCCSCLCIRQRLLLLCTWESSVYFHFIMLSTSPKLSLLLRSHEYSAYFCLCFLFRVDVMHSINQLTSEWARKEEGKKERPPMARTGETHTLKRKHARCDQSDVK